MFVGRTFPGQCIYVLDTVTPTIFLVLLFVCPFFFGVLLRAAGGVLLKGTDMYRLSSYIMLVDDTSKFS